MSRFHDALRRLGASPGDVPTRTAAPDEVAIERAAPVRVWREPASDERSEEQLPAIDTVIRVVVSEEDEPVVVSGDDAGREVDEPAVVDAVPTSESVISPHEEPEIGVHRFWDRVGGLRDEIIRANGAAPTPEASHEASRPSPLVPADSVVEQSAGLEARKGGVLEVVYVDLAEPLPIRVEIVVDNIFDFIDEYASHVSESGIFVGTDSPLPEKTTVDVHVLLKEDTLLQADGVVAWTRSGALRTGDVAGMGIRFRHLSEASHSLVRRMVSGHVADGGVPFELDPGSRRQSTLAQAVKARLRARAADVVVEAPPKTTPPSPSRSSPRDPGRGSAVVRRRESARAKARRQPRARATSSMRSAYDRIIQRLYAYRRRGGRNVVFIASAVAKEGASTVARNMAKALAGSRSERVVLVDANLRTPSQHRALGVARSYGLTDVLGGEVPLRRALHIGLRDGFALLPSGRGVRDPSRLLNTTRFHDVVSALRTSFDWVIVDCPPITTCPDAVGFADSSGTVLLVLEAERTRREVAEEARNILQQSNVEMLGVILNRRRYHIPDFIYRRL